MSFIYTLAAAQARTTEPSPRGRYYYSTKGQKRKRNPLYNKRAVQLLKRIGGLKNNY